DAETPWPQRFEIQAQKAPFVLAGQKLQAGRYVFQVKHHRTADRPGAESRASVVGDFTEELTSNVLNHVPAVNYFFLITNVPSSKDAVAKVDEKRSELLSPFESLNADVLWQEHVYAWLDQSPHVWKAFPEIFPGHIVPFLGQIAAHDPDGLPRSVRIAIET